MLTSVQNPKIWKWGKLMVWVPIWTRRPENQGANGVVSKFDPRGPRTWRADVQGRRRWITWFKHKANLSFPLSFYFIQILNWLDDAHMHCHVICSVVSNSVTTWTIAHQAPLSMEFSRQKRSGLPFLPPGDLPDPGIELGSPVLQANSLLFEPPGTPICIGKGDFYSVYQFKC